MFRNPDFLRSERFSLAKTAIEKQELAACCAALFRYPEVNMEKLSVLWTTSLRVHLDEANTIADIVCRHGIAVHVLNMDS
jgi:hypothetical protein